MTSICYNSAFKKDGWMIMSKFIKWFLVSVVAAMLTACGGGGSGDTQEEIQDDVNAPKSEVTYELEEGNHALMGPLSDATVSIFSLTDLLNPIETVQTGEFGAFTVFLDGIPDDTLLLVAVSGGEDIDVDDNGELDDTPTANNGTIHAYAKASELKASTVNVTLLSEIIYQYTRHYLGNVHPNDLEKVIDRVATKFFTTTSDKNINSFIPTDINSRNELNFEYLSLQK